MSIVLSEDRGPVRHLVLNRPEKRNALNDELIGALHETFADAAADRAVLCVVVRGAGPMFSSGIDLGSLAAEDLATADELAAVMRTDERALAQHRDRGLERLHPRQHARPRVAPERRDRGVEALVRGLRQAA